MIDKEKEFQLKSVSLETVSDRYHLFTGQHSLFGMQLLSSVKLLEQTHGHK